VAQGEGSVIADWDIERCDTARVLRWA